MTDSVGVLRGPSSWSAGRRLKDPKHRGASAASDFPELEVALPFRGLRGTDSSVPTEGRGTPGRHHARGQSHPFAHLLYQLSLWVFFLSMLHILSISRLNVLYLIAASNIALIVATTYIFFPSLMFTDRGGVSTRYRHGQIQMSTVKMEDWFNTELILLWKLKSAQFHPLSPTFLDQDDVVFKISVQCGSVLLKLVHFPQLYFLNVWSS